MTLKTGGKGRGKEFGASMGREGLRAKQRPKHGETGKKSC